MVRLYGVVHGASEEGLFSSRTLAVHPCDEILQDLTELPHGVRVGLEWFEREDWREVKEDLMQKSVAARIKKILFFEDSASCYWQALVRVLLESGLQPVFLEEKEIWKRYNQACVDLVKQSEDFPDNLGKSARERHGKLCQYNEALEQKVLASRRIHELERDHRLLCAVASNALDIAIVGIGHGDYWVACQEKIQQELGITFDSYSQQRPSGNNSHPAIFVREGVPSKNILFERELLERALRLREQGRVGGGTPDYVGIWNYFEPYKGYFEVFVHQREREEIAGVIEDLLGTAKFKGKIDEREMHLTKTYTAASADAFPQEILYKWVGTGEEWFGQYTTCGGGGRFYMREAAQRNPLEMSLRWFDLRENGLHLE